MYQLQLNLKFHPFAISHMITDEILRRWTGGRGALDFFPSGACNPMP